MKKYSRALFIVGVVISLSSCRSKPGDAWESGSYKYGFNPLEFKRCLMERFNKQDSSFQFQLADLENSDSLKYFYTHNGFNPVIIKSFEDSSSVESLLNVIAEAKDHGLDPLMYKYEHIRNELSGLYTDRKNNPKAAYSHMVNVELLLSDAVVKFSHNMHYGAVNPLMLFPGFYCLPYADSGKGSFLKPLYQENILNYLKAVQPSSKRYRNLQVALKYYEFLENHSWPRVQEFAVKLKKGEENPGLKPVALRLAQLGFIDTMKFSLNSMTVFDSTIIKPVMGFQKANGLIADGSIGKETIKKLNTTPKEYLEKIKLSLERLRWAAYPDSGIYIMVNIPEFYLHAMENGEEKLGMRVCTGKKSPPASSQGKQKKPPVSWETPMLHGEISHLVLNPTWTVPVNIVKKEIYGLSVKDSNYLKKNNFKVFRNGKLLSLGDIKLKTYSPNHLPFTFVQDAGAGNALGKIKFMFDNPFGVYLHDTPTRPPFSRSNRAVSHGCVRVEKPFDLAGYILKENSRWNIDFIKLETGYTIEDKAKINEFKELRTGLRRGGAEGKTTRVRLERKIPLYIDYFTAWVDKEGIVNFRDDVYDKDKILKEHLPL